ncbi:hypothetical protein GQ457_15G014730 [Hibiscus cannabinus]
MKEFTEEVAKELLKGFKTIMDDAFNKFRNDFKNDLSVIFEKSNVGFDQKYCKESDEASLAADFVESKVQVTTTIVSTAVEFSDSMLEPPLVQDAVSTELDETKQELLLTCSNEVEVFDEFSEIPNMELDSFDDLTRSFLGSTIECVDKYCGINIELEEVNQLVVRIYPIGTRNHKTSSLLHGRGHGNTSMVMIHNDTSVLVEINGPYGFRLLLMDENDVFRNISLDRERAKNITKTTVGMMEKFRISGDTTKVSKLPVWKIVNEHQIATVIGHHNIVDELKYRGCIFYTPHDVEVLEEASISAAISSLDKAEFLNFQNGSSLRGVVGFDFKGELISPIDTFIEATTIVSTVEAVFNHQTITAFSSQGQIMKMLQIAGEDPRKKNVRQTWFAGLALGTVQWLTAWFMAFDFRYNGKLTSQGYITAKTLTISFLILVRTDLVFVQATSMTLGLTKSTEVIGSLFAKLGHGTGTEPDKPYSYLDEQITSRVEICDIDLDYPARLNVPILKDISITIEDGKSTTLVGQSGSCKSTIISLIEGFNGPLKGVVKIDGRDIKSYNLRSLRKHMVLVSREPTLFYGIKRQNILYGASDKIDEFKIIEAAKAGNTRLHHMPCRRLQYLVQKQRCAIWGAKSNGLP